MEFNKLKTQELKGIIIGMVLGDGYLSPSDTKKKNSFFRGSSIHESYIKFKSQILSQITSVNLTVDTNRKNSFGNKPLYLIETKVHPTYTKLRMRLYHNNKRVIDPFCIKSLHPLGILIWYLDDGSLATSGGKIMFRLHSNRYSYLDHLCIQKIMNDKFGLRWNICKNFRKAKGIIYYQMILKPIDRLKFYDKFINPYIDLIPEELKYKIPIREDIEFKMNSDRHKRFYENIV